MVVHHRSAEARGRWFDGYVQTYLERDLQSLRAVEHLPEFRRLMRAASLRIGQLLNQTELGRDVGLPQPTVRRYLNLLETSYQLVRLEPFSVNRTKRLIKTPKIYWSDTGLAHHLRGGHTADGPLLENLVFTDLLAWRDASGDRVEILYWRTASQQEVDFVIETPGGVVPVEVEASDRVRPSDTRHLGAFLEEYPDLADAGVVLYTGETTEWIVDGVLAVPWWRVM
ncbi:MAG: ATP-binding protein [Gemmatimonadota bacterium]